MSRAIVSVRVSTDEQARFGYSLPTQLDGCRKYAQENGFEIIGELIDDCSGTIPFRERPQGKRIFDLVESGTVDAVVMYTADRTARDELVIEYLLFKAFLFENNVQLHYADNGLDPYTMEGNLMGYLRAFGASAERKKIVERCTRGRDAKARSGKWVGSGVPPYGYRKIGSKRDARLEINEDEANVIRRVFAEYISGKGGSKIAADLTAECVPFPSLSRNNKNHDAISWYKSSLIKMIRDRRLLGEFYFAGINQYFPELAIIDEETFQAAQEMRAKNRVHSKRNSKTAYLLSGMIFCHCGRRMSGRSVHSRPTAYYNCNKYNNAKHQHTCLPRWLRADITDRIVWDWLVELLTDEVKLNKGLEEMNERSKESKAGTQARYIEVCDLIGSVERRVKRLVANLGQVDDDTVAEELGAQVKMLTRQKDEWIKERKNLEDQLAQGELSKEAIEWIREKAVEIRGKLKDPTYEEKRDLLKSLDLSAKLRWDENGKLWVDVSCGIKVTPESLPLIHPSSKDDENITPKGKIKRAIAKQNSRSRQPERSRNSMSQHKASQC